jgi:hypothetical protein
MKKKVASSDVPRRVERTAGHGIRGADASIARNGIAAGHSPCSLTFEQESEQGQIISRIKKILNVISFRITSL